MKKCLIFIALVMALSGAFAFEAGDMMLGGNFEAAIFTTWDDSEIYFLLGMMPQVSGFVAKNVAVDVSSGYISCIGGGHYLWVLNHGVGARCFYRNVYAGLAYNYEMSRDKDASYFWDRRNYRAHLLTPKLGAVAALGPHTYLDFHAYYRFVLGEAEKVQFYDNIPELKRFGFRIGFMLKP